MASFLEARGPAMTAVEGDAGLNRPASGQVQLQPQERTSGQLPSFSQQGKISPGVYNPAKERVGNEKLYHAPHTTTLLMNTLC